MEKFCVKLFSIIKLEIANYLIVVALCIIAIIVCAILRDDKKYKILLWLSIIGLIIIMTFFANAIVPVYKDYCNKSFVQLENVTVVSPTLSGFDLSGKMEITVYTTEGNVIRLTTIDQLPKGEYKANIVYTEKSNYLVDWKILKE